MSFPMIVEDQIATKLEIHSSPKRIISTVPSQTELLADLGLSEKVVGITKFCVHPAQWRKEKTIIGGTKNLKLDVIRTLEPDLIIANKEENEQSQIETLANEFPVFTSDIKDLGAALDMINLVGQLTGTTPKAITIQSKIETAFGDLAPKQKKRAVYLIWNDPMMAVNRNTFIHDMMMRSGFENVLADHPDRYPIVEEKVLKELNPEVVLLSSEPFPFKEKHAEIYQSILPQSEIKLVDGEYFSWYGSRLMNAPSYFRQFRG